MRQQGQRISTNTRVATVFFLALLGLGILIHDDYGLGWDESTSRAIGLYNAVLANHRLNYFFISREEMEKLVEEKVVPEERAGYLTEEGLEGFQFRYYGPVFELVSLAGETVLPLSTQPSRHRYRHLLIWISWLIGLGCFWGIIFHFYEDWRVALFGTSLLLLCPRIFAHAFFNPKDIPFLAAALAVTYTLIKFMARPRWGIVLLHSIVSAIAMGIRPAALIFIGLTVGLFFWDTVRSRQWRQMKYLLFYLLFTPLILYLEWPYLWESPLITFGEMLKQMKYYPWGGEVLFMGEIYRAMDGLPWYYFPIWFGITVPVFTLAGGLLFFVFYPYGRWRQIAQTNSIERFDLIALVLFFCPWLAAVVFQSVLYDGWRHFYFVYPFFCWMAMRGLLFCCERLSIPNRLFMGLVAINMLWIAVIMVRLHPHQQVYFNLLAGDEIERRYEGDYWGVSTYQGWQYIIRDSDADTLKVGVDSDAAWLNTSLLSDQDRDRVSLSMSSEGMDYFITVYRSVVDREAYHRLLGIAQWDRVFSEQVQGRSIMEVFRRPRGGGE